MLRISFISASNIENHTLVFTFFQVEAGIHKVDEFYIISGRVCLINCYGAPNTMGLTCQSANRLTQKYCIRLFTANVYVRILSFTLHRIFT